MFCRKILFKAYDFDWNMFWKELFLQIFSMYWDEIWKILAQVDYLFFLLVFWLIINRNDNNNGAQNGGNGDVVIVKSEANDSDLYDAAIEPSGQHGPTTTTVASPTKSPAVSRQASSSSQLPTLGLSNPNSGGRRYCCYIGKYFHISSILSRS